MSLGTPEYFAEFTKPEWRMMFSSNMEMPKGYEHFTLLVFFWILSTIFQGFALPFDAWTSQRYYAAKDERESSLVAFQWIVLLSLRFILIVGLAVMAMGISGMITEPEKALPETIKHYFPPVIKGIFIAALIAAGMSTVDSIVNSSAAYFVKDIYQQYIKPKAGKKHLIIVSYFTTVAIVAIGIVIGLTVKSLNSIWGWIIMGLLTGMMPPNIFKWFWWRSNGMGYAFGMGAGMLGAVVHQLAFSESPEYVTFLIVILISTAGTVLGTFLGKPTGMDILINFYKTIKPFGVWGPVRRACAADFVAAEKKENRRNILLLLPACLWQATIFWIMVALVAKKWDSFAAAIILEVVLSFILYKYWYKNLKRA
jgi:Na+/proline symporter